jgi:hypothetical protein
MNIFARVLTFSVSQHFFDNSESGHIAYLSGGAVSEDMRMDVLSEFVSLFEEFFFNHIGDFINPVRPEPFVSVVKKQGAAPDMAAQHIFP